MSTEHRVSIRENLAFYVDLKINGCEEAVMVDLNESGARIIMSAPQAVDTHIVAEVVVDKESIDLDCLSLELRVARCKPALRPEYFEVGCEIIKQDACRDKLVQELMTKFGMNSYE